MGIKNTLPVWVKMRQVLPYTKNFILGRRGKIISVFGTAKRAVDILYLDI